MALSTISGTTGITDATITSAKLADFAAAVDLNGVELILDADQDTSITADTDDRIDFKIAGVEHISISNSSGDTVIKPMVDAKDILFQQYDGRTLLDINDGGFVGIANGATGAGAIRIFEDTDNGSNYVGLTAGSIGTSLTFTLPTADGSSGQFLKTNGSGALSFDTVSSAADDLTTGDAAVTIATSSGNITIDAQAGDTDIIFKGTDSSSDITALTLDMSAAGEAIFNAGITIADAGTIGSASDKDAIAIGSDGDVTLTQDLELQHDGAILSFGANDEIALTHVHDTGLLLTDSGGTPTLQFVDANESISSDGGHLIFTSNGVSFDFPSADGSNGQALVTNGSGVISFADVAANTPSSADGQALGSASLEWSDLFLADGGTIQFGNDQEVRLIHNADKGLLLKHTATADDKPIILTLQTGETDMAANDVMGKIEFQAPDEGTGTDAILVSAAIQAVSEGDFSSSANATRLEFMTGASEAAASKATLSSGGILGVGAGVPGDLGVGIHIKSADSGASVDSASDELVVEGSGSSGMTILSGTSGEGGIKFGDSGDNDAGRIVYDHATDDLFFLASGTELLRIDSSAGSVDIGGGSAISDARLAIKNTGNPANLYFQRNTDSGAIGGIFAKNNTGNSPAFVKLESDGASEGHFEFDSSGDPSNAFYFKSGQTTSSNALLKLDRHDDSDASDIRMIQFEVGNQGRGYVVAGDGDSDAPNFAAGSDRRLKKNITDYTGGIDIIKAIKIRKFDEEYTSKTDIVGWVADEVKPTLPEAIGGGASNTATRTVTNAVVDENGRLVRENTTAQWLADEKAAGRRSNSVFHDSVTVPEYQTIMPQKMFPYVFAALKESIAKIEALEARVTTLEG